MRLGSLQGETRYYSADVHHASFVLPPFVTDIVA
jgi:spermidine synthase